MDLALSISLSGMIAARDRLNIAAQNIANAGSSGALPDGPSGPTVPRPYTPLQIDQRPIPGGGTQAQAAPVEPRFTAAYEPDEPVADASGQVAVPAVDLASEALSVREASEAYRANARVFSVASAIDRETLDLLGPRRHDVSA